MNRAVGAQTPDDERRDVVGQVASPTESFIEAYPYTEPKPMAPEVAGREPRGTESRNAMVWSLSAMAAVLGVAVFAFMVTSDPLATAAIAAIVGVIVLMLDHRTT